MKALEKDPLEKKGSWGANLRRQEGRAEGGIHFDEGKVTSGVII